MTSSPLLSYGIYIHAGRPGSGKSYSMVRQMCDIILQERRPVFTNLPLNFRTVRAYLRLKGGARAGQLIYPLKRDRWFRFLELVTQYQRARDDANDFRRECERPPMPDDPAWIPPGSCIMLDEVHHWHPMLRQGGDRDMPLQTLLTMHRHFFFRIHVASQDDSQINIIFRKNAAFTIYHRDIADDTIGLGLTFKSFGVRGLGWTMWTGDAVSAGRDRPELCVDHGKYFPALRCQRWPFRLYQSFSHVATAAETAAIVKAFREDNGDTEEPKPQPINKVLLMRMIFRYLTVATAFIGVGVLGYVLGSPSVLPASEVPELPRVGAISRTRVELAGQWLKLREQVDGYVLEAIDTGSVRRAAFTRDDGVYVAEAGQALRYVGTVAEVRQRLEAAAGQAGVVEGRDTASR